MPQTVYFTERIPLLTKYLVSATVSSSRFPVSLGGVVPAALVVAVVAVAAASAVVAVVAGVVAVAAGLLPPCCASIAIATAAMTTIITVPMIAPRFTAVIFSSK